MSGYYLIFFVSMAVSMGIQFWLKSTYRKWGQVQNTSSLTGAETAKAILEANGLTNVTVEAVKGQLTDHYDPRTRTVRLSEGNYAKASVAGMAVAAHEVGHAIQHAKAYGPLQLRHALVRPANIGSQFGMLLIMGGFFLGAVQGAAPGGMLLNLGILLFAASVLFHVVTLPVEFDASRRALVQMKNLGLATDADSGGARKVLTAAAMTYVAAAATSIAYLLYFIGLSRD